MTDPIEQEIKQIQQPLLIQLPLEPNEKIRLARLAHDSGCSESQYILGLIREQLNSRVGAAVIRSASQYSQKVSGPSHVSTVTRG